VFTDAKQRVVTASPVEGHARFFGYIAPKQIVCAEPSPDVAQAVSASLAASIEAAVKKLEVGGEGSAALALATSDSIAQLGERLGTIQLLRDQAYRACEAYSNGAISSTTYTLMMSRLDRTMTTLLLGEMAAGAFGRRLASISGSASSSVFPRLDDLKKALDEVENAKKEADAAKSKKMDLEKQLADAEKAANESPTDENKKKVESLKGQVNDANGEVTAAELRRSSAERALRERSLSAVASGQALADAGQLSSQAVRASGTTLVDLQRQAFDVNELAAVLDACITATDRIELPEESRKRLEKVIGGMGKVMRDRGITEDKKKERIKELRDKALQIAQTALLTPFAQVCVANLPIMMDAVAKRRELPITQVEEEKAKSQAKIAHEAAEVGRIKLCETIWGEALKEKADEQIKELAAKCAAELFKGEEAPAQGGALGGRGKGG
jgi:hypothetical protein